MKEIIQHQIRWIHEKIGCRSLPGHLGIYFHELNAEHYPAIRQLVDRFNSQGYRFTGDPLEFAGAKGNERVVFLSIDDNFRTSFELLDLADELNIRFAVYLNTMYFRGHSDESDREIYLSNLCHGFDQELLSQEEVSEIADRGHTIGAHTHTHRQLSAIPHSEAEDEIRRSKEILEELLGSPVKHFSYPFGMRRHFTPELRTYCSEIGFETVANAIPGLQHSPSTKLSIQRSGWMLDQSLEQNLINLRIDGRLFERLTGRSAVA